MNLMFWKKKPATGDNAEDLQEKPVDRTVSRETADIESSDQRTPGEAAVTSPSRPKQRLIIVAAIVVPVLATIGWSAWKIFSPSPEKDTATTGTPASIRTMALPEKNLIKLPKVEFLQIKKAPAKDPQADIEALRSRNEALRTQIEALKTAPAQAEDPLSISRQAEIEALRKNNDELQAQIGALKAELPQIEKAQAEQSQADIDALKKKNNELQAQIEALKKKQLQLPSTSPASRPTGKVQPAPRNGDLAIGSKNPKTTAMTLKEAIEAMNAGSGEPAKPTAK